VTSDKEQILWGIHCASHGDPLFMQKEFIGIGWKDIGNLGKIVANREAFK